MIAKRISFESMLSSACVTAKSGGNIVNSLKVKRTQLTIRLREISNSFQFIDALCLQALLHTFFLLFHYNLKDKVTTGKKFVTTVLSLG